MILTTLRKPCTTLVSCSLTAVARSNYSRAKDYGTTANHTALFTLPRTEIIIGFCGCSRNDYSSAGLANCKCVPLPRDGNTMFFSYSHVGA